MHDRPGANFKDGGRLYGGPMDGKTYRHPLGESLTFPGFKPRPVRYGDSPSSPVRITTCTHHYRWNDFLGGYLYSKTE
jgi:hypothetical protein